MAHITAKSHPLNAEWQVIVQHQTAPTKVQQLKPLTVTQSLNIFFIPFKATDWAVMAAMLIFVGNFNTQSISMLAFATHSLGTLLSDDIPIFNKSSMFCSNSNSWYVPFHHKQTDHPNLTVTKNKLTKKTGSSIHCSNNH